MKFLKTLLLLIIFCASSLVGFGQERKQVPTHHESGKFGGSLLWIYEGYLKHQSGEISDEEYRAIFNGYSSSYFIEMDSLCQISFPTYLNTKDTLDYKRYNLCDSKRYVKVRSRSDGNLSMQGFIFYISQLDEIVKDDNVNSISLISNNKAGTNLADVPTIIGVDDVWTGFDDEHNSCFPQQTSQSPPIKPTKKQ